MMQAKYRKYYNTSKTNNVFKHCKNHFFGGVVFIKWKGEFVMVPGSGKPTETALSGVERRGRLAMMHLETRHYGIPPGKFDVRNVRATVQMFLYVAECV